MKLSKLFHWLYFSIMMLPVFFLLPSALYYGFNEHAKVPEETNVVYNYKYETNEVNTLDDLVLGNVYHLDTLYLLYDYDNNDFTFNILKYSTFEILDTSDYGADNFYLNDNYNANEDNFISLTYTQYFLYFNLTNSNSYTTNYIENFEVEFSNVDFCITSNLENFIVYYESELSDITSSEFNVLESVTVETDETPSISTIMAKSWSDVWQQPVFSWTNNTFFNQPFTYIANLFGIESTNPLCNALSYWFSVSIIWLVFDIFLYVPLLCHRWLDKAAIE